MKYKTISFKDPEAVAAWLNRKNGNITLHTITPVGPSKFTAIYEELEPSAVDAEFVTERADELINRSNLRMITVAELTNSVRNLKRFSKLPLPALRTHVFNIVRDSERYTLEPMRRGYTISRKGGMA